MKNKNDIINLLFLNLFAIILLLIPGCKSKVDDIKKATNAGGATSADAGIQISEEEMQHASNIYFDRCAGCHGATRKGATGPSLLPDGDGKYPYTK